MVLVMVATIMCERYKLCAAIGCADCYASKAGVNVKNSNIA